MVHILLKAKEKGYLCAEAMDPAEGDLVMVNGKGKCTVLKRMGMRLRVEVEETGKPSWSEVTEMDADAQIGRVGTDLDLRRRSGRPARTLWLTPIVSRSSANARTQSQHSSQYEECWD